MVHAFKIENDNLELDVEQILQYPALRVIYARDDSKDKEFAYKEFRFIHFMSDRKGYIVKSGMNKQEAVKFATENSGLNELYKPDKEVWEAIEFIKKNLNLTTVEDLISSTIKGLKLSGRVIKVLTEGLEEILAREVDKKDLITCEETLKKLIEISNDIPDRIEALGELNEKWDKMEKGVTSIRGGHSYRDSYDGTNDRAVNAADEVETLS